MTSLERKPLTETETSVCVCVSVVYIDVCMGAVRAIDVDPN